MSRRVKLVSAAAVLTAGLVLALRFPNGPATDPPAAAAPSQGLTYRSEPVAAGGENRPAAAAERTLRADAETRPAGTGGAVPAKSSAPALPPVRQRPADVAVSARAQAGDSPATGVAGNPVTAPGPSALVPRRTHTIRDGDTLAGIAQQYLGQSDRAYEIFQLNRDRLVAIDLLPIGTVLRLPLKQAAATSAQHEPSAQAAGRLVPIPAGVFARPVAARRQVTP